jgi:DUF4097 and DUF4098 domain-containing protein YvlB
MKFLAILGLMMAAWLFPSLHEVTQDGRNEVREQINRSVALSSGAQVTIKGINGSVTIETLDGAETAEIDITITASSREAMQRRPLLIEEGGNSLTIRTEDQSDGGRRRESVHHRVRLRLPRSVSLGVSGVNGGLSDGAIGGGIAISGINGRVRVDQAGSATEIKGVNGGVTIALDRLGESGLRVSGVNGGVELGFGDAINAQLEVRSVNGSINSEFPLTVQGEVKRGELTGTIGSGGAPISISGVNGGVNLRRR